MSQALKSCVSQLETVELSIRRRSDCLTWKGEKLSPKNQVFMCDLYVIMSCLWYDVSLNRGLLNPRWVSALMQEPVDQVVDLLKDVDFEIISKSHSTTSFNHWRKSTYPSSGQILAPLQENLTTFFKEGVGLPLLRTALRFITRANFPDPLGLEDEAFGKWQDVCLKECEPVDVSDEADLISQIFPRRRSVAQIDDFRPRFGPGASYGLSDSSTLNKYLNFEYDPLLFYVGHKCDFLPTDMPRHRKCVQRNHGINFVPKQLDRLRVVSQEIPSLMFYQLGIQTHMVGGFASGQWCRHIDLHDADKNRDLAWEGSLTGEYATIDLSSASDSVRLWLVKALFHNTNLRELLIGTRSVQAEYKGEYYTPTYFAPMGSGTCFPVECAVFASVVDVVMRHNRDTRNWRVYGDDIICPSERAEEVIDRLTQLGFEVNVDKSFYSTSPGFRESCGGDYYLGESVRPIYISRFFKGLTPDPRHPSTIATLIDLANSFVQWPLARLRVLKELNKVKPCPLYTVDGEGGIFSTDPSNHRSKSRYNEDLQRIEYRTGCINSRKADTGDEHEDIRYFEYLRAHAFSESHKDMREGYLAQSLVTQESKCTIGPASPLRWAAKWQSPALGWSGGKGI